MSKGATNGKVTEQKEVREEDAQERESDGAAVRSDADEQKTFEVEKLLMGDRIFIRIQDRVYPATVTSDGAKDKQIELVYFDGSSGRTAAVKKCEYGRKNSNWWHDSKELLAAIEFERQCYKAGLPV
ncbi:MAG: hypothetical protein K2X77_18535 [Candidatus Obscuribacterales bacterium]|jgi:hypothetical protein|nr:hypothetical protein [Candidatus Obscuribacterales bacterium]